MAICHHFNLVPETLAANLLFCRKLLLGCWKAHHPWTPHLAPLQTASLSPGSKQHLAGYDLLQKQPLNFSFETKINTLPSLEHSRLGWMGLSTCLPSTPGAVDVGSLQGSWTSYL